MTHHLCHLAGDWRGDVPEWGVMAEPKVDGWRCLFFPDWQGKPTLWSRNGIPLQGVGQILRRLIAVESALGGGRWFIDGELLVDGTLAATKAHCERGWRQGDAGTFHAFDAVPLADWKADRCDIPLYRRKELLAGAIRGTAPDPLSWEWAEGSRGKRHGVDPVQLVPDRWCNTAYDVAAYAAEVWRAGGEGLMLKDAESPYQRKRSKAWQKVKHPDYVPGQGIVARAA